MDTLNFEIDYYKVLQDDDYIMLLEADIVNTAPNYNTAPFEEQTIIDAIPSLANKPLIAVESYNHEPTDHAKNEYEKEKIKVVGIFPESNNAKMVDKNGYKMLRANIAVWKYYNGGLVDFIKKNALESKNTKLSMEIAILDSFKDNDGLVHITKFKFVGVCLLGTDVTPAILSSCITVSKFSVDDKMIADTNMRLSTFSIPQNVKDNAKIALSHKQKNPQLINIAKEIVNSDVLTYSKIEWINNKINSLRKEDNLIFCGGNESKEWCKNILNIENYSKKGEEAMEEVKEEMSTPEVIEPKEEEEVIEESCGDNVEKESCGTEPKEECSVEEKVEEPKEEHEPEEEVAEESCGDKKDYSAELQKATEELVGLTAKYEKLTQDYSIAMEKLSVFEAEKAKAEKAKLIAKAEKSLSTYSEYVTEDEKKVLFSTLEENGIDAFNQELNAIVLPKTFAKLSAIKPQEEKGAMKDYSYVPDLTNVEKEAKPRTSRDILREMANK